jgi:predicted dehydrogenase
MSQPSKPIRVAVIGAGSFGSVHLKTYSQLAREGRVELVGVADTSEDARAACEREYERQMYGEHRKLLAAEKPDAVSVVTPDHTHRDIVCDALATGCHVLVEKPMDTSLDGCRKMIAVAKENGLLLQVDFHKRFDPYHAALRQAVREGQLGRLLYGYAWMEDRISVPREMLSAWSSESSPGWFLGSHMIDLFRWIVGGPKGLRVFATGQKNLLAEMGIDTWDAIQAQIAFEDDVSLSLNVNWILPDRFEAVVNQGIRVVGTEGITEIDSQNRGAEVCTTRSGQQTWNLGFRYDTADKWGRPRHKGYGYESIADFVENIEYLRGGGTLDDLKGKYPDGDDGLETTRILVAIHESIISEKAVSPAE